LEMFHVDYGNRLSSKTINDYKSVVKHLVLFSGKNFSNITSRDIRNWINHLDSKGCKPSSMNSKLYGLKRFYSYCLEEGLLYKNPVELVSFVRIERRIPRYLENHELILLRNITEKNKFYRAFIEVLFTTGIRISELLVMKLEDINWSERSIQIPKGKGNKGRIVLFTRQCAEYLNAYLKERHDELPFVFVNTFGTGPACYFTILYNFRNFSKKIGIKVTPHILRHTFAAHLAIKGMPLVCIQMLLGHIEPKNTQIYSQLYTHARKEKYDEWM
jgi:site-specific recombinase XerD